MPGSLIEVTQLICAHSGRAIVRQKSESDCMLCCIAMYCGLDYEQALRLARHVLPDYDPQNDALPPALMRRAAHAAGVALLSSIYFDWRYPGIVGVPSLTFPGFGHALFWDGEQLIDPGCSGLYDLEFAKREAVEYAQRASHLSAVVELDAELKTQADQAAAGRSAA